MNTLFLAFIIIFDLSVGVILFMEIKKTPKAWKVPFIIAATGLIVQAIQSIAFIVGIRYIYELPIWFLKDLGIGCILYSAIQSIEE